jgi:hypothetical protein
MSKVVPFDPLQKRHLAESVAQALLRQPAVPMEDIEPFEGAGIYAIYYDGAFHAYEEIAKRNSDGRYSAPIYIGKAIPKGGRKGYNLEAEPGRVLFNRLMQHVRSLQEARSLDLGNFRCRILVADDVWIPLGETLLIAKFNPLWNLVVDGFGNHDPGKGRHEGLRPRWDVLHPGRSWAENCKQRPETADQIIREVREFLRSNPPPDDTTMIST